MSVVLNWLIEPLSYPFMQVSVITALMIAVICAVLSCYLVLKGWALMGDAISHAVLPGIVLAFMFNLPLTLGAFIAGIFCASSVGFLKNHARLKEDTIMGIVFSGMFAFGLVLFNYVETTQHLTHILFGDILGIDRQQMWQMLTVGAVILLIIYSKWRDLLLYCFDPIQAKVAGLNTTILHYGLLTLLSLAIVLAMQIVGVILVVAMLISPGITAYLLTKRFSTMLLIAISSALLATVLGIILSFHLDSATGATIVLTQASFFICAVILSKIKYRRHKLISPVMNISE
ncbi:metal ABC transporter permease [Gallibacterium salpingitidis]|uniref:Iron ABC transporter permease n=1 Tax=Gallibacterium salpingitidis TaxID=505341 RepID=A0A1A7NUJ3_9PAST|nr:metal ABC transporter permease [Gallibacterium salpingitidis]OBW93171.1 iron ABC transporter permease [Gallibacterium salpingitidis]